MIQQYRGRTCNNSIITAAYAHPSMCCYFSPPVKIPVDCKCKGLCCLLLCLLVVVGVICADFALFQQLQGSVSSLLQTVAKDEDMSWARREQQALGMVPSTGGGRNCLQTVESWNLLTLTDFYSFYVLYSLSSIISPPQSFPLQFSRGLSRFRWREGYESLGVSPLIQPKAPTI